METPPSETTRLLDRILAAVSSIRYGSVQIVIQDSKVVRIEKVEKIQIPAYRTTGGTPQTSP
ncbi:MAG: YezD family protein [Candidatus Omnitrophica bacterium]|nr:YezD family protein [Candidatus Omnitrophota bacterium]